MEYAIEIDGELQEIDIRVMDERLIVWRKMLHAPLTADDMATADPEYLALGRADGRFTVFEEFFRKQIRIVGSCMVLAWKDDGIIGKMHFTTREVHEAIGGPERWSSEACYCVDHNGFAPKLKSFSDEELTQLLRSYSRTLRIVCFNIGHMDPRWHGHGIAKAMAEYLVQWARENGWRRVEARSCLDITPTSVVGDWMLRRGPLERLGFRVLQELAVLPEEASHRLEQIEFFLSGSGPYPNWCSWYAENVHRLAESTNWRLEYDKDYIMARELQ
jgi:GNAT superfamily N-acetyltransferase